VHSQPNQTGRTAAMISGATELDAMQEGGNADAHHGKEYGFVWHGVWVVLRVRCFLSINWVGVIGNPHAQRRGAGHLNAARLSREVVPGE
tara:strand:+ start:241 stop:510 length:270 start_codon:yes stop_codon:yes gene_type:complete